MSVTIGVTSTGGKLLTRTVLIVPGGGAVDLGLRSGSGGLYVALISLRNDCMVQFTTRDGVVCNVERMFIFRDDA